MSQTSSFWAMLRKLRSNWNELLSEPTPACLPTDDESEAVAIATNGAFESTAGVLAVSWDAANPYPDASNQEVIAFPNPALQPERPPLQWTVVLSDTDNDFEPVRLVLWLTGLADLQGCWNPDIPPIQVVHTGDWLNKWNPNPHVLDSFKRLAQTAPEGVQMTILVGNHELSILRMAEMGLHTPFTEEDLTFIRSGNLTHILNDILFLHGYPSPLLLNLLTQIKQEETPLNDINTRLHAAFFQGEHALFRETLGLELTGDVGKPKSFYGQLTPNGTTIGQQVASQLNQLGITTVIHGHKPVGLTQTDDELERFIPGVRVINNDNSVRTSKLGALLIDPWGKIIFINPESMAEAGGAKAYRKRLRKLLKTRHKDLHPSMVRKQRALRSIAA